MDGGRDELRFVCGAHGWGFDIFQSRQIYVSVRKIERTHPQEQSEHTFLAVNFVLEVEVEASDDDVGDDVQYSDPHKHLRIIEGYLLRDLHHT